eukprot:CAMPEP_0184981196 /NCGR_PEP_ID=MMETSP1098-20130426/11029_1 /TAXON_ID=89044 /ORGANISM="Spumella elongata, Strain CCAP 955/1" /LENGTH=650 /DNA_ID=CAMNT_0027504739 /DNA_START=110 /DNA_END=2062 /DNA_ORIENTATION=-
MLTLSNAANAGNADFNDQWKVLIYDKDCRDIISPLLNVGALRQKGVTLHMEISSEREPVPDAPAVYFVRPTEANIKRIAEDCAKQLYRTVYLNFVTRIERSLMEKLAQDLVNSNSVSMVSKIYDQYLDVIALEPSLFTLNIKDSFMLYNEPSLSETQIRAFMSRVASGLLSTVRVMGVMPIIRCAPGGAAEMLAQELNSLLRENISARGPAQALFEDAMVNNDRTSRPLLLISDRISDLFPVLQHASTYQALINDLLDLKLNRVTIEAPEKEGAPRSKRTYDLNTQLDGFLRTYAGSPFPEAVDANEKELNEVSQREAALRSRPDFAKQASDAAMSMAAGDNLDAKGRDMSQAIESLPELLAKKANLDVHTSVLQAVMSKIALREIPTYFEIEQNILTNGRVDKPIVVQLLRDGSKGILEDKARLLLLVAVSGDSSVTNKASNDELDAAFVAGCEAIATHTPSKESIDAALAAVQFMRRLQSLQSGQKGLSMGIRGGGNSNSNALLTSFLNSAHSRATNLIAKAASFFTKFTPYYVTRTIVALAEGRSCPEDDLFLYLDPRSTSSTGGHGASGGAGSGQKYTEVIVFVLGGGNYSEYYNLQEVLKDKTSGTCIRNITYGCTDMLSGDAFVDQLKRLAKPSGMVAVSGAKA